MQRFWVGMTMVAMMAPQLSSEAHAEQVKVGLRSVTGYSSNIFGRADDEVTGSVYSLRGNFELGGEQRLWNYDLLYQPSVNGRGDANERVSVSHRAQLRGSVRPTQRTTIDASSRLSHQQDFRFDLDAEELAPGNVTTDGSLTATRLWNNALLTRRVSPRITLTGSARYTTVFFEGEGRSDNLSASGSLGGSYVLTQRLRVGGGGSVQYREFDDRGESVARDESSRMTTYQVYGNAVYQVSPGLSVTVQAGPTFLTQTRQDNRIFVSGSPLGDFRFPSGLVGGQRSFIDRALCDLTDPTSPPTCNFVAGEQVVVDDSEFLSRGLGTADEASFLPPLSSFDGETSTATYFATVELTRRFKQGRVTARYTRSEQPTSGNSSTSLFDEVSLDGSLPLSVKWRLIGRASWLRSQLQQFISAPSQSVNVFPSLGITGTSTLNGPNREILVIERAETEGRIKEDLTVWRAAATLEYRLTRRFRAGGRFEFRRRVSDTESTTFVPITRDFNDFRGVITLNYTWDPIRL